MCFKPIQIWFFVILLFSSASSFAAVHKTLLVKDGDWQLEMPARFRTTGNLPTNPLLNLTGFDLLHLAGSAQFTKDNLTRVINYLPSKKIIVVDLRKESHGFLNDKPISWYGVRNATNAKKTPAAVEKVQASLLSQLSKLPSVIIYNEISKNEKGEINQFTQETVDIHDVQNEKNTVEAAGLIYKRFYVTDHDKPDDETVKAFLQFYKTLPKDTWLYFHCRGGSGRTSTFMVMVDMLQNVNALSFDDILARQVAIGGEDLRIMPDKNSFEYPLAVERLAFLKKFYEYAKNDQ